MLADRWVLAEEASVVAGEEEAEEAPVLALARAPAQAVEAPAPSSWQPLSAASFRAPSERTRCTW